VPSHTVCVIGTTSVNVPDPEPLRIEPWEVRLMLEEGDKMVPGFAKARVLRAWAGVRPLFQDTYVSGKGRDVTRKLALLDHKEREGVGGFLTITGGKWTTFRLMAEVTVNRVCEKFGVSRPTRTHEEVLPHLFSGSYSPEDARGYHFLGSRLARAEQNKEYGNLICECELATREDVEAAIVEGDAKTFDDVRRDVRLGMGPCQGGFCTYRVTGMLHDLRQQPIEQTNVALRDFLQERWKGVLPILWGSQLKQQRLDELIYLSVLNADHLPGETASRLGPSMYEPGTQEEVPADAHV
jgi:glycerol-3-phosphate dehydrogenase